MVYHGIFGLPVVVSGVRAIRVELDRLMKVERWMMSVIGNGCVLSLRGRSNRASLRNIIFVSLSDALPDFLVLLVRDSNCLYLEALMEQLPVRLRQGVLF